MDLRPYQQQIVEAVIAGWGEFNRQLVVSPTGSGKTIMFAHLAERVLKPTLILAHREELLDQAIAKVGAATGIEAEKEKAERRASRGARVVVGSVQTLCREERLWGWPQDHFGLVVVDEAHHTLADSYRRILAHFDARAKVVGVTATPDRGDQRSLGEYYESTAAEIGLFDLIAQGYLCPITLNAIPLQIDLGTVRQQNGDFRADDLGAALDPYLDQIAAAIRQYASFRRTLAFLPLIATSRKFTEACRRADLEAEHIDGDSPNRAQILANFAAGKYDVLSNAMLLTEGYDQPEVDCVVVLRPTRSRPLYAQMVGRGTRIHETKDNLLLLDFLWHHQKHALCRPANLIAHTQEEADQITALTQDRAALPADVAAQAELDLRAVAGAATAQREENLRRQLAEHKNKRAKHVSAEEFALAHGSLEAAEFFPTMRWESQPITDKQAKVLRRAKIDLDTVRGRGHASRLIDLHMRDQHLTLASVGQRALMARMGHANAENATAAEARQFFANLRK